MRETRNLEFKENITDSFLKTVSAFANYGNGRIMFGVDDCGNVIGLADPADAAIRIENKINDAIKPQPEFKIDISDQTGILTLTVSEGNHKPYFYRSRAYKRGDSSTIEVDSLELSRLILDGSRQTFDAIPFRETEPSFQVLRQWISDKMGISEVNLDVLKTLELCDAHGDYNNAASLVADANKFPGIDIVIFGETISIIKNRYTISNVSVLRQFEEAMRIWEEQCTYEVVEGATRRMIETIPKEAFREAIANAIVHRTWDVEAHIKVSIYADRIDVSSPGGLPSGIGKEEYLSGRVSILRNPILGNLMYRLNVIERFGTGVTRIKEAYKGQGVSPIFSVGENSILITLPVVGKVPNLTEDEQKIYKCLSRNVSISSSQIIERSGFGKSKTLAILKRLMERGIIQMEGTGRGTKYLLTGEQGDFV